MQALIFCEAILGYILEMEVLAGNFVDSRLPKSRPLSLALRLW